MRRKTIFVFNAVIFDMFGRILIENRNEKELPQADKKWGLPGGRIEFGETPEEAVAREVFEETGYIVEIDSMIPISHTCIWHYRNFDCHTVVFGFYGRIVDRIKGVSSDKDVNCIKWMSFSEIEDYSFLPGVIDLIMYSLRDKGNNRSFDYGVGNA